MSPPLLCATVTAATTAELRRRRDEAGAALVLIHAHRELEKIVTTAWQRFWKDHLGEFYGKMLHEGHFFEPALRDIEAMIDRSQERVTGEASVRLDAGAFSVTGVRSPHTMARAASGVYGEMPKLWTGADVKGFSAIAASRMRPRRSGLRTGGLPGRRRAAGMRRNLIVQLIK